MKCPKKTKPRQLFTEFIALELYSCLCNPISSKKKFEMWSEIIGCYGLHLKFGSQKYQIVFVKRVLCESGVEITNSLFNEKSFLINGNNKNAKELLCANFNLP